MKQFAKDRLLAPSRPAVPNRPAPALLSTALLSAALLAALLLAAGAGCDSETTAPQDEPPPVSAQAAAQQGAYLAYYLLQGYDVYAGRHGKDIYSEVVDEGNVSGSYKTDYRCGGAARTPCADDGVNPDYVRIWTDAGQQIVVKDAAGATIVKVTFDVEVDPYNPVAPESGTLTGGGTLVAGIYSATFTITGVFLSEGVYPPGGTLTYDSSGPEVTILFDGSRYATLEVGSADYWVYLTDGSLLTENPAG